MSDETNLKNNEDLLNKIIKKDVPKHIAIIMDGNGRWAKNKNLPRIEGHRRGAENITSIVESANKIGVKDLTVYAFSIENWQRPKDEVDSLMDLFEEIVDRKTPELAKKGVQLRFIGNIEALRKSTINKFTWAKEQTKNCKKINLNVAVNYSGRDEIVRSVKKTKEICEDAINSNLDTKGVADPELLIRTSGEFRISNFMLWQLAYTELYFTDVLWPDFKEDDLFEAVIDFQGRKRRFGGLE